MLRIALHIFPMIQIALFVGALEIVHDHLGISIALLFLSALFMNFSLHITVHHYVHFRFKNKSADWIFDLFYTLLLGLPFNFYRMQHFNHHRYNNLIGDFTSTWKKENEKIVARNFLAYSFFWFLGKSAKYATKQAITDGDASQQKLNRIKVESIFLLCFYATLLLINPIFALAYFILFYTGWSLIAITNYGQHMPIKYGETIAYSYHNKFYNFLFFNNGLHFEHHENPQIDYPNLKSKDKSPIKLPHLIVSFFHKK